MKKILIASILVLFSIAFNGFTYAGSAASTKWKDGSRVQQAKKHWQKILLGLTAVVAAGVVIYLKWDRIAPFFGVADLKPSDSVGKANKKHKQKDRKAFRRGAKWQPAAPSSKYEPVENKEQLPLDGFAATAVAGFANYKAVRGNATADVIHTVYDQIDSKAWGSGVLTRMESNPFAEDAAADGRVLTITPADAPRYVVSDAQSPCILSLAAIQQQVARGFMVVDGKYATPQKLQDAVAGRSSLGVDTSGACHVVPITIFTEAATGSIGGSAKALCKLREGDLSGATPVWLISAVGLTETPLDIDARIDAMWRSVLAAAVKAKANIVVAPAIGLGVFKGDRTPAQYFDSLCRQMHSPEFVHLNVYFNPCGRHAELQAAKRNAGGELKLHIINADTMLQAAEFAKLGVPCALVNPANGSVITGSVDVGNSFKTMQNLGEQYIAAHSTAPFASYGLAPQIWDRVYTVEAILAERAGISD